HDPQLTYRVVALLARLDRPPIPDAPADAAPPPRTIDGSVDTLVTAADESAHADDPIGVYANLWQACVRFPRTARGWAEYACCFAERYEWKNCRIAISRAIAFPGVPDTASATALLAALCELAEHNRIAGLDWESWLARLPESLRSGSRVARLLVAC